MRIKHENDTSIFTQMCYYSDPEHTQNEQCGPPVLTGMYYAGDNCYEDGGSNPCNDPATFNPSCGHNPCPTCDSGGGANPPNSPEPDCPTSYKMVNGKMVRSVNPCNVEQAAKITNNVKDPCLHRLVDSAIKRDVGYELKQSMNGIFNTNTKFNLDFYDKPLAYFTDGETEPTEITGSYVYRPDGTIERITNITGMDIKITLNSSTLPNSTEEYVTATILHEALHAYFKSANTTFDHDIMVRKYIPWYKASLHAIYPSMTEGDLTGLAYGGLMQEAAFQTSSEYAMKSLYEGVNDSYKHARSGIPCH